MHPPSSQKYLSLLLILLLFLNQTINIPVARSFFPFTDPAKEPVLKRYSLVAVLVDSAIYKNETNYAGLTAQYGGDLKEKTLAGRVIRYAKDVQSALEYTKTVIIRVAENESPENIAFALEKLYMEGDQTDSLDDRLSGIVLVGNVPLPVVNKNGNRFVSLYPYTDFIDKRYVFNAPIKEFEITDSVNVQPEIWHGVISPPKKGEEGNALLASYFDKNHLYHIGHEEFATFDKKIFYHDLYGEGEQINKLSYQYYLNFLSKWQDIQYLWYNKNIARELWKTTTGGIIEGDGIDDDKDGRIDEEASTTSDLDKDGQQGEDIGDPFQGKDNDGDGKIDEDGLNDNDADGDGLKDEDPPGDVNGDGCAGECDDVDSIIDSDGDGYYDWQEIWYDVRRGKKPSIYRQPKKKPKYEDKLSREEIIKKLNPHNDDRDFDKKTGQERVDEDGPADNDADKDGLIDEDPGGISFGGSGDDPFALLPDIQSKWVVDRFYKRYYELFSKLLGKVNQVVDSTGRWNATQDGAKQVDTPMSLIYKKDEMTMNYLKTVNNVYEQTIDKLVDKVKATLPYMRRLRLSGYIVYKVKNDDGTYTDQKVKFHEKSFVNNSLDYVYGRPINEVSSPRYCTLLRGSQSSRANAQTIQGIRTFNYSTSMAPEGVDAKKYLQRNYDYYKGCFGQNTGNSTCIDLSDEECLAKNSKCQGLSNEDCLSQNQSACPDLSGSQCRKKVSACEKVSANVCQKMMTWCFPEATEIKMDNDYNRDPLFDIAGTYELPEEQRVAVDYRSCFTFREENHFNAYKKKVGDHDDGFLKKVYNYNEDPDKYAEDHTDEPIPNMYAEEYYDDNGNHLLTPDVPYNRVFFLNSSATPEDLTMLSVQGAFSLLGMKEGFWDIIEKVFNESNFILTKKFEEGDITEIALRVVVPDVDVRAEPLSTVFTHKEPTYATIRAQLKVGSPESLPVDNPRYTSFRDSSGQFEKIVYPDIFDVKNLTDFEKLIDDKIKEINKIPGAADYTASLEEILYGNPEKDINPKLSRRHIDDALSWRQMNIDDKHTYVFKSFLDPKKNPYTPNSKPENGYEVLYLQSNGDPQNIYYGINPDYTGEETDSEVLNKDNNAKNTSPEDDGSKSQNQETSEEASDPEEDSKFKEGVLIFEWFFELQDWLKSITATSFTKSTKSCTTTIDPLGYLLGEVINPEEKDKPKTDNQKISPLCLSDTDNDGIMDCVDQNVTKADNNRNSIPDGAELTKGLRIEASRNLLQSNGNDNLEINIFALDQSGAKITSDNFTKVILYLISPDKISAPLTTEDLQVVAPYATIISENPVLLSGGQSQINILSTDYQGSFGLIAVTRNLEKEYISNKLSLFATKEKIKLVTYFKETKEIKEETKANVEKYYIIDTSNQKKVAEVNPSTAQILLLDDNYSLTAKSAEKDLPTRLLVSQKTTGLAIASIFLKPKNIVLFIDGSEVDYSKEYTHLTGTHMKDLLEGDNVKVKYSESSWGAIDIIRGTDKLALVEPNGRIFVVADTNVALQAKPAGSLDEPLLFELVDKVAKKSLVQFFISSLPEITILAPAEYQKTLALNTISPHQIYNFDVAVPRSPPGNLFEIVQVFAAPSAPDSDADGLSDLQEITIKTNWNKKDTDGDGINDFDEIRQNKNPLVKDAPLFSDLSPNHEAYNDIITLYLNDVIRGYSDGYFRPNQKITREEFIKVDLGAICKQCTNYSLATKKSLDSVYLQDPFPDTNIDPGLHYCIADGKVNNIISGYKSGDYAGYYLPKNNITRAEATKVIIETINAALPVHSMQGKPWYYNYVLAAQKLKLYPEKRFKEVDTYSENDFQKWVDSQWASSGPFIAWLSEGITRAEFAMMVASSLGSSGNCFAVDTDSDYLPDVIEKYTYGTNAKSKDTDQGGVNDYQEIINGTDPNNKNDDQLTADEIDVDGDSLSLTAENKYGADPNNWDSDGGGESDGSEVNTGKNPLNPADDLKNAGSQDYDGDGLTNSNEEKIGTDKNDWDTDNGGESDGSEINTKKDPLNKSDDFQMANQTDYDGDNLSNSDEENKYKTDLNKYDTDNGGESDGSEIRSQTDPLNKNDDVNTADSHDYDGDGLTNEEEFKLNTNPNSRDSDSDGLSDYEEVKKYKTDPNKKDTDQGGISDYDEIKNQTNPLVKADDKNVSLAVDWDKDGLSNAEEKKLGTDLNKADTDNDGLTDYEEVNKYKTDPLKSDTDGGGESDGSEIARSADPLNNKDDKKNTSGNDNDGDGLTNDQEKLYGTDQNKADTDSDGLNDKEEIFKYQTDPLSDDTDQGGVKDSDEIKSGTDPKNATDDDPDKDGLSNFEEKKLGTDPKKADTDGGGVKDGAEIKLGSNPLNADDDDPDGDSLNNGAEKKAGTDMNKWDTDGGGEGDGSEIAGGRNPLKPQDDERPDSDSDGLTDEEEKVQGTDPNKADTDADGVNDGDEIIIGTDPLNGNDGYPQSTVDENLTSGGYVVTKEAQPVYAPPVTIENIVFKSEIPADGQTEIYLRAEILDGNGNIKDDSESIMEFTIKENSDNFAEIAKTTVQANKGVAETTIKAKTTVGHYIVSAKIIGTALPEIPADLYVHPNAPAYIEVISGSKILAAGGDSKTNLKISVHDLYGNIANYDLDSITLYLEGPIRLLNQVDEDPEQEGIQITSITGILNLEVASAEEDVVVPDNKTSELNGITKNALASVFGPVAVSLPPLPLVPIAMDQGKITVQVGDVKKIYTLQILDDIKLKLSTPITKLPADGKTKTKIRVEALDPTGKVIPNFTTEVSFKVLDPLYGSLEGGSIIKMNNGVGEIEFKTAVKAGEAKIMVTADAFKPDILTLTTYPGPANKIILTPLEKVFESKAGNEFPVSAILYDQYDNLAYNDSQTAINFRLSERSKPFATLKNSSLKADKGKVTVNLIGTAITGPVTLIASVGDLIPGALEVKTQKIISGKSLPAVAPQALFTSLLGLPAGRTFEEDYLGGWFINSGKIEAALSMTEKTDQPKNIFTVTPNGKIDFNDAGMITAEVIPGTPSRINLKEEARMKSYAEVLIRPKTGAHLNILNTADLPAAEGIYLKPVLEDEKYTYKLKSDRQTKEEIIKILYNNNEKVIIDKKLNITLLDSAFKVDFIEEGTYPAYSFKLGDSEIARLIINQSFASNVKLLPGDFNWSNVETLGTGIYVKIYPNPYLSYVTPFSGRSTLSPKSITLTDLREPIDSLQSVNTEAITFDDAKGAKSIGFEGDQKFILLLSGGSTVGEASKNYLAEAGIVLGDPTVSLKRSTPSPNTGFTKDIGRQVLVGQETIKEIVGSDWNNDGLTDILLAFENKIKLLQNTVGRDRFLNRGDILQVPNGILSMTQGDINNDGYEDLIIATKDGCKNGEVCVDLYENNKGSYVRRNLPLDTAKNVYMIRSGDMNRDGYDDLVTSDSSGNIKVYYSIKGDIQTKGQFVGSLGVKVYPDKNLKNEVLAYYSGMTKNNLSNLTDDKNFTKIPVKEKADEEAKEVEFIKLGADANLSSSVKQGLDINGEILELGDFIKYTVILKNTGSSNITKLYLNDAVPSSLELDKESFTCLSCAENIKVEDSGLSLRPIIIGNISIPAGKEARITYQAKVKILPKVQITLGHNFYNYVKDNYFDIAASPEDNPTGRVVYYYSQNTIPKTFVTNYSGSLKNGKIGRVINYNQVVYKKIVSNPPDPKDSEVKNTNGFDNSNLKKDKKGLLVAPWMAVPKGEYLPPKLTEMKTNLFEGDDDKDGLPNAWDELSEDLEKLAAGMEKLIAALQCGGGCISLPINYAFLAPGTANAAGIPSGYDIGFAIFAWAVPIPLTPMVWPPMPQQASLAGRLYISPTLTGGVGFSICLGPFPIGQCISFAPPIMQLILGSVCDAINSATSAALSAANSAIQDVSGEITIGAKGKGASTAEGEETTGGLGGGFDLGPYEVKGSVSVNIRVPSMTMIGDWLDRQWAEVRDKWTDLPDLYFIYPTFNEIFKPNFDFDKVKSYQDLMAFLNSIPFINIKMQDVNFKFPWMTKKQIDQIQYDAIEWVNDTNLEWARVKKKWVDPKTGDTTIAKGVADSVDLDVGKLIKAMEQNIKALEEWKRFPYKMLEWRNFEAYFLKQIICYLDAVAQFFGGWQKKLIKRYYNWVDFIDQLIEAFKSWKLLVDLVLKYNESCDTCQTSRFTLLELLMKIFLVIPQPPVIPLFKIPDIYIDLSQWQTGVSIIWPAVKLKPARIVFPPIPRLRFPDFPIQIKLPDIPVIPSPPELPSLPELPALPLPQLPTLPPPPKVPSLDASISAALDILKTIMKILCILKTAVMPVMEGSLKTHIEAMTERPLSPLLPIDLGLKLQWPKIPLKYPDKAFLNVYLQFTPEISGLFEKTKKVAKGWNIVVKDMTDFANKTLEGFAAYLEQYFAFELDAGLTLDLDKKAKGEQKKPKIPAPAKPVETPKDSNKSSVLPPELNNPYLYGYLKELNNVFDKMTDIGVKTKEENKTLEQDYKLVGTIKWLGNKDPILNRPIEEIKNNNSLYDNMNPAANKFLALKNKLISYYDQQQILNKKGSYLAENGNYDQLMNLLVKNVDTTLYTLATSIDSQKGEYDFNTNEEFESATEQLLLSDNKSSNKLTELAKDDPVKEYFAAVPDDQGSGLINGNPTKIIKGIFSLITKNGEQIQEKIVSYTSEADKESKVFRLDVDRDKDSDMIYSLGGDLYYKENYRNDSPREHVTSEPQIVEISDLLPSAPLVNFFQVESVKNKEVNINWQKATLPIHGYEINASPDIRSLEKSDKTGNTKIHYLNPDQLKITAPILLNKVNFRVIGGKAEVKRKDEVGDQNVLFEGDQIKTNDSLFAKVLLTFGGGSQMELGKNTTFIVPPLSALPLTVTFTTGIFKVLSKEGENIILYPGNNLITETATQVELNFLSKEQIFLGENSKFTVPAFSKGKAVISSYSGGGNDAILIGSKRIVLQDGNQSLLSGELIHTLENSEFDLLSENQKVTLHLSANSIYPSPSGTIKIKAGRVELIDHHKKVEDQKITAGNLIEFNDFIKLQGAKMTVQYPETSAHFTVIENENYLLLPLTDFEKPLTAIALDNGSYYASISSFNEQGYLSTVSNNVLFAPQVCADKTPPFAMAGSTDRTLSVFKKLDLDASSSFDLDGQVISYTWDTNLTKDSDNDGDPANDEDYWRDLDALTDTDKDGLTANDATDPKFTFGPFEELSPKKIRLTVKDEALNVGTQDININMIVPEITLNPEVAKGGVVSGQIEPKDSEIPIVLLRKRGSTWQFIKTKSADQNSRYFTNYAGQFVVDDLNLDDSFILKDEAGKEIAKINSDTGEITLLDKNYKTITYPANPPLPTRIAIVGPDNKELTSVFRVPDANTDVTIDDDTVDYNQNPDLSGVHVKDSNPKDPFSFLKLPGDDPYHPGGVKILKRKQKKLSSLIMLAQSSEEETIGVIKSNGAVLIADEALKLNVSTKNSFIFNLNYNQENIGEVYIAVNGSSGAKVLKSKDAFISSAESSPPSVPVPPISNKPKPKIAKTTKTTMQFEDVAATDPYYSNINEFVQKGVLQGYLQKEKYYFLPDKRINRAEFTKILLKILCIVPRPESYQVPTVFSDIAFEEGNLPWYYDEVKESFLQGFIYGYLAEKDSKTGLTPFKPDHFISRAEAAKIILEALNKKGIIKMGNPLRMPWEAWYAPYMDVAIDLTSYLTKKSPRVLGEENYLLTKEEAKDPEHQLSRGEFVAMATRVLSIYDCSKVDSDQDGCNDTFERDHKLNPNDPRDQSLDPDKDNLINSEECKIGSDPHVWDTDGGGRSDGEEAHQDSTDPLNGNDDIAKKTPDDLDGDGLTNSAEKKLNTDENNADTDGDSLKDGAEVNIIGTDPNKKDSDQDGLSDGAEYNTYHTNPLVKDTDGDGLSDGDEVNKYHTDPLNADTDGDALSDGAEINQSKTDPLKKDTDGDKLNDGEEVNVTGTNPLVKDTDSDTLTDYEEVKGYYTKTSEKDTNGDGKTETVSENVKSYVTNPLIKDTDGDGLTDGEEIKKYQTSPLDPDTDGGGESEGTEVSRGANPLDPKDDKKEISAKEISDTDGDGLTDQEEKDIKTNANNKDTDNDGLSDFTETKVYGTNPLIKDTDGDGLADGDEVNKYHANPTDADTDGDGLKDGAEINNYKTDPLKPDTDQDGLTDGEEVSKYKTEPLVKDTDSDGLMDGEEIKITKTNPLVFDTDKGGKGDGDEVVEGLNPLNGSDDKTVLSDSDEDGLSDQSEINKYKTDPANSDTDGDGLSDGEEIEKFKTDPLNSDTDGDGLTDGDEINQYKTDPLNPDTDEGGVSDGAEVLKNLTDPLKKEDDSLPVEEVNLEEGIYILPPECNTCPCPYLEQSADSINGDEIFAAILSSDNQIIFTQSEEVTVVRQK